MTASRQNGGQHQQAPKTLTDVAHLMASRFAPRASWQVPHRNLVLSLPVLFLHFLQRVYGSACHQFLLPLIAYDASKRKKALQNVLVLLCVVLILVLISVTKRPTCKIVDYEILRNAKAASNRELRLRQQPSLDVEIGLVLNGTLLFHVSLTEDQKLTSEVMLAEVARKKREFGEILPRTENGQSSPELSKYVTLSGKTSECDSRTNSENALSLRNNQIWSDFLVQSSFENAHAYQTFYGQANVKGAFQHSRTQSVQGNNSIRKSDSNRIEADRKDFKNTKNGTGASLIKEKRKNKKYFLAYVVKGSKNVARSCKRSIKSKTDPTQNKTIYEINQPNPKYHTPKDDCITRASKSYAFDDVIVTSRSWEPVRDNDKNLFVYSAFYDDRSSTADNDKRRVRVLGISVLHELRDFPDLRRQVFCHYRWKTSPHLHVSQRGRIMSILEDHNKTYHAVFIICELHLCGRPDYVGITVERNVLPLTYLPVKYPLLNGQNFKHNFTTCLPVMHSHYSNKLELLQVLEADKIWGAEKFTLYLHSASPEVLEIIRHYVTSGVMEAIEWRLPFTDVSLVHYFGQMAAINDCLYNSQYTSRYVVFHDFDELLFPRKHDTWNQMLEAVQLQEESWLEGWRQWQWGQYGSYTFLHVCFPKNWTHPGRPGNAIIEGSDVAVRPGAIQPFVYGYAATQPSAKDEIGNKYPDQNGNGSFGTDQNKNDKANIEESETNAQPKSVTIDNSPYGPESSLHEAADERKLGGLGNAWSKSEEPSTSNLAVDDSRRLRNNDDKSLPSLHYTWRENLVWAPAARSKMLVKPSTVEMMGIHSVHMHIKGYQSKNLAAEMALVHHYRMWWVRNGTAMIYDTTAHRLASRLTANVNHVLRKVLDVQLDNEN